MARKKKSSAAPLERAAESLDETSGAQSGVADAFEDQIESACRLALIHYQQEDRAQAIESLRALTNTHPKAHLPHRYMGRVLFHEAALLGNDRVGAQQQSGFKCLEAALQHAVSATQLAPASLSCAALRATLLLNMILEQCVTADSELSDPQMLSTPGHMLEELGSALQACRITVASEPCLQEEPISISVGALKTHDPCCLQIHDRHSAPGSAQLPQMVAKDKMAVLGALMDVMQRCSKALHEVHSTPAAASGLLRLILSPGPEELQSWSQQLVGNTALQHQTAHNDRLDLIGMMQPQGPDLIPSNLSLSRQHSWEHNRDLAVMPKRGRGRGKADRRAEMTPEDCYLDVKDFWLRLSSQERSSLLRVPIRQLILGVRKEQGDMAAADITYGLQRLRANNNTRACFWVCCYCPNAPPRFDAARQYQRHLEQCHEEVQVDSDGRPLPCSLCQHGVVGAWYRCRSQPSRRMCLRCYWQEENAQRISRDDYMRMEPDAPGSAHSIPAQGHPSRGQACNGSASTGPHGLPPPSQGPPQAAPSHSNGRQETASSASSQVSAPASTSKSGSGLWQHLSAPFNQWKAAASAKLSDLLAQPRYPHRYATSESTQPPASSSSNGLTRGAPPHSLMETYQAMQQHWEALRMTIQREGLAGRAGPLAKDLLGQLPPRQFEDSKAINPILEYIKRGLVRDRDSFQVHLQRILDRVSQQPASATIASNGVVPHHSTSVITTNAELEMRLRQLSPSDLQLLLFYMFSFDPSAFLPHLPAGSAPDGLAGITREYLNEEDEMEMGCPPLFEFASQSDASMLEHAANDAVEKVQLSRDADEHLPSSGPYLHVQQWWYFHLMSRGGTNGRSSEETGLLTLLQWVYGNVTNTHAEEFQQRRRDLLAGQLHDAALANYYHDLAGVWRRLWDVTEKKKRLIQLRQAWMDNNKEVKELEDTGMDRMRAAMDFVQQLPASPTMLPSRLQAEATMQQLQTLSISQAAVLRYSLVLVQREVAKNDLLLVALDIESAEAAAEAAAGDRRMMDLRQQVWDAESELNKAQTEGPANHRKRDHLDKATKEAEHRDRLDELRARIADFRHKHAAADEQNRLHKEQQEACKRELQALHNQMRAVNAMLAEIRRINSADNVLPSTGDAQWQQRLAGRLQQLHCVAQAIAKFGGRQAISAGEAEHDPLLHAMSVTKKHLDIVENDIVRAQEDIARTRHKLQDITCVDMAVEISDRALEVVRTQIEAAAAAAKEAASHSLLLELEEEAAQQALAKKASESKRGKKAKGKKDAKKGAKGGKADSTEAERLAGQSEAAKAAFPGTDAERLQQQEAEYEAALEQRRREVEAERLRRDLEQLRMVTALSCMPPAPPAPAPSAGAEDDGYSTDGSEGSVAPEAQATSQSAEDLHFDEATRAAIEASLKDLQGTSEQAGAGEIERGGKKQKKKSRKQRYKENLEKAKAEPAKATMRIVTHHGDWQCECGATSRLWDTCTCGRAGPCRDWVRGRCKYQEQCRFQHPPFDLRGPPPPSPVACPSADAVLWVDGILVQAPGHSSAASGAPQSLSHPSSSDLDLESLASTDATLPPTPRRPPAGGGGPQTPPLHGRRHPGALAWQSRPGASAQAAAGAARPAAQAPALANGHGGRGVQRTKSLPQMDHLADARASRTSSQAGSEAGVPLSARQVSEPDSSRAAVQDEVVAPPPRSVPAAQQLGTGWSPMGSWGIARPDAQPAPVQPSSSEALFHPFGDNPLMRAFASSYKREPEAETAISVALPSGLLDDAASAQHSSSATPTIPSVSGTPPAFSSIASLGSDDASRRLLFPAELPAVPSRPAPAPPSVGSLFPPQPSSAGAAAASAWPSNILEPWSAPLQPREAANHADRAASLHETLMRIPNSSYHAPSLPAATSFGSEPGVRAGRGEAAHTPARPGAALQNATGDHHCFLNALIQGLWHAHHFHRAILGVQESRHVPGQEMQVLLALKDVFASMDAACQASLHGPPSAPLSAVEQGPGLASAAELRSALARCPDTAQVFRSGELSDAAEALEAVLGCLDAALLPPGASQAGRGTPTLLKHVCGLSVDEVARCEQCKRPLHRLQYTKFSQVVMAATLRTMAQVAASRRASLELQLRREATGALRFCDPQQGGCGLRNAIHASLRSAPLLYTVTLAWPGALAPQQDIGAVLTFVQSSIDLGLVYPGLGTHPYQLRCMVCFYGSHYVALAMSGSGVWHQYDDTQLRCIGDWQAVTAHCQRGCLQPLLLFYEAAWSA